MGLPPKRLESVRESVIALARTFLGQPYVWGGETPATGFDCSGLVKWVLGQHGIPFPKWSRMQWEAARPIEPQERLPGDLVFFEGTYPIICAPPYVSHVGILVDASHMINANSERGIAIDDLTERYWYEHLHSFGRVIDG